MLSSPKRPLSERQHAAAQYSGTENEDSAMDTDQEVSSRPIRSGRNKRASNNRNMRPAATKKKPENKKSKPPTTKEITNIASTDEDSDSDMELRLRRKKMKTSKCKAISKMDFSANCDFFTKETHHSPLYGCDIAPFLLSSESDKEGNRYLVATTGGSHVMVYIGTSVGGLKLRQIYRDTDDDAFYACKFTLDENGTAILICAGKKGIVRILDVQSMTTKSSFAVPNVINDIAIHPKHRHIIAIATKGMAVYIWNIQSGVNVAILSGRGLDGHSDELLTVDFNEDGSKLVSSGMDHYLLIWDTACEKVSNAIELSRDASVKEMPRPVLPVWVNFPIWKCANIHKNYVDCAKFLGDIVISKSSENLLCAWTVSKIQKDEAPTKTKFDIIFQYELRSCTLWFMKFAIDPEKRFLAQGMQDGRITVFDLWGEDPTELRVVTLSHASSCKAVRQVAFSPDGKILVAVCDDSVVTKWSVKRGTHKKFNGANGVEFTLETPGGGAQPSALNSSSNGVSQVQ